MKELNLKELYSRTGKSVLRGNFGIYLIVMVVFQIICLIFLFVADVTNPNREVYYSVSDFAYRDHSNVYLEGDDLVFTQTEGISTDSILAVSSKEFPLKPGAYQFYVSYDSDTDGNDNFFKSTGSFTVESKYHEIETETVTLDDGHNEAVGRFWIPAFTHYNDLSFTVKYNGQGTLRINNCKVVEFGRYRAVRFVAFLAGFMLVDAMYICLFTDSRIRLNKSFVAIALVVFTASIPFIDEVIHNGHDLCFHLLRIVELSQGLYEGQFPVRIATEANNGYGYANSLYYCDIFLYPSAILYKFRVPLRVCYQVYVIIVNGFTGFFTYYAMSKFSKKPSIRIIGTMLYMLCAYRLANLNIRSSAGEYTAMCFLPLIVVGFHNIMNKEHSGFSVWFPLAAGMSGVIMSHIVTAEMVVINIFILCVMSLFKLLNIKRIVAMLKAVLASVMMTAWFIIPFIDSVMNQSTSVQKEDLRMLGTTTQSGSSLLEIFTPGHDQGNWISLGLPFVVGILLLLYCLYSWKNNQSGSKEDQNRIAEFRIICLFSFMNILFVSKVFPWNKIQNLLGIETWGYLIGTIQFAWRFLSVAAILLSIAVVMALGFIYENKRDLFKVSTIIIISTIIIGCGYFYHSFYEHAWLIKHSNMSIYSMSDPLYYLEGTDPSVCHISKCRIKEGEADIDGYSKEKGIANLYVKNASGDHEAKITVPIFAYNNYHVFELQDGSVVGELPHEKDENNCILITVPAGFDGNIQIRFIEPTLWRVSEVVSLVTWSMVSYIMIFNMRNRVKQRAELSTCL